MIDVVMPQLGESVTEGTVVAWRKQVGDRVVQDEYLCDVTTDKVTFEVPAPTSGTLESVLAAAGDIVPIGGVIARLSTDQIVAASPASPGPEPAKPAAESAGITRPSAAPVVAARAPGLRPSPLARRLAREARIDVARLSGSGKHGRVRSADVLAAIEQRDSPAGDDVIPFSPVRKQIAEHMMRSVQTSPHGFIAFEIDYTAIEQARSATQQTFKSREGFGLTYLPFVLFALAEALRAFPLVNSSVDGERLIVRRAINLGIAVDLDHHGLIVPVIRDADGLSVAGLARKIADLARRARDNRITGDDLRGGTFTVTNPGKSGTLLSVPIINQPQTAILVTDGVERRPAVVALPDGNEALAIRSLGYVGLSMDHRAFDGAYAAAFLSHLKRTLQELDWMSKL